MRSARDAKVAVPSQPAASRRPLSALLSQILVAFTVEFDNEFERRMGKAGYPGDRLSLVVWSNLLRFVGERGVRVRDLPVQTLAPLTQTRFELGCLERWGFVVLREEGDSSPRGKAREGWGSGRGIRSDWVVGLTQKGLKAVQTWPALFGVIERRWRARFGEGAISHLRQALIAVVRRLDVELPHGLPMDGQISEPLAARRSRDVEDLSLPAPLSQALLAYTIEFNRQSKASLALCANVLRVLGQKPISVGEISGLTGCSPERTAVGWQLKPYVALAADPTRRGKIATLTSSGLKAQETYRRLTGEIENGWETRFGKNEIQNLRNSLQGLFELRKEDRLLMSLGLIPSKGVTRAGEQAPALGRKKVATAALQRMRDLVAQTEDFVRDPANRLPHFPLWDMNRGFGP